ncbi:hypothetical protein LPJ64_002847 [Coemansia asiatica]|uniref:EF-hand domain-containing protein n=1 Tax=Coemansia asiatica TaxID=1052880 RepID=A0A9W8CJA5_9FUNG|nr:hypothetical protein LPJ64_002847 [Coemansia asiatica]
MSSQDQKDGAEPKTVLSESQIKEFRAAFDEFDKDGNGSISKEELESAMKTILGDKVEINAEELIKAVDKDGDGEIDFVEFTTLMAQYYNTSSEEEELREAFKVFDKNGDGFISADELRQVMTSLGERLTDAEVDEMIKEADADGDGKINYEEFVKMMVSK